MRVPLTLRWDGHVAAGQRVDTPASLIDIARTVVEVAGGNFRTATATTCSTCQPTARSCSRHSTRTRLRRAPGPLEALSELSGQPEQLFDVSKDKGERTPVPGFPLIRAQLRGLIANFRTELGN